MRGQQGVELGLEAEGVHMQEHGHAALLEHGEHGFVRGVVQGALVKHVVPHVELHAAGSGVEPGLELGGGDLGRVGRDEGEQAVAVGGGGGQQAIVGRAPAREGGGSHRGLAGKIEVRRGLKHGALDPGLVEGTQERIDGVVDEVCVDVEARSGGVLDPIWVGLDGGVVGRGLGPRRLDW